MKKINAIRIFFAKKDTKLIKYFFALVVVLFALFFVEYSYHCVFEKVCSSDTVNSIVRRKGTITAPNGVIRVEVADTKSSRVLGLSGRKGLAEDTGLLFIFDTSGKYGFWMKDMLFPLDIIWINDDGFIVEIERNISPDTYPKTYVNAIPARYVLEVQAGEAEKKGVYIGTKVNIEK